MDSKKYIGMDVHKESISIAVRNDAGKILMECVIETKASTILQFIDGLRGEVHLTLEEGTWAAWLYDLIKPHVTELVVCNPRRNALLKEGSKSDRIDVRKLAYQELGTRWILCSLKALFLLQQRKPINYERQRLGPLRRSQASDDKFLTIGGHIVIRAAGKRDGICLK